jgi:hypothetical protein
MRNIKTIYWIFTIVFAVLTAAFAILAKENDRGSLILSGAAIVTSCIALGLSDKKQNKFKGKIILWSALYDTKIEDENSNYRVSIKIINKGREPIYDVVYRVRIPSAISARLDDKNRNAREYRHGKSLIIVDDSFGFLGEDEQDGFIPIDFTMRLRKWKESAIYITVSGSNINPTTFKISQDYRDRLIAAKKGNEIDAVLIR